MPSPWVKERGEGTFVSNQGDHSTQELSSSFLKDFYVRKDVFFVCPRKDFFFACPVSTPDLFGTFYGDPLGDVSCSLCAFTTTVTSHLRPLYFTLQLDRRPGLWVKRSGDGGNEPLGPNNRG